MNEQVELRGLRWTIVVLFAFLVISSELILGLTLAAVVHTAQRSNERLTKEVQVETDRIECLIVEALGGNVRHAVEVCSDPSPKEAP